ncbi:MAG TPA: flagellar motor protein MotB [Polyangiaceae bacterium]|nr:flagellar motor protein MotB [Polyangiaceae bacterium]
MTSDHLDSRDFAKPPPPERRSGGWFGWLLFVLALAAAGAFVHYFYLPLRQTRARLDGDLGRLNADLARAAERERALGQRLQQEDERFGKLSGECDKVATELKQTVAEKEKIESELKRVQGELSQKLEPEITSGNIRIRRRGQELVLDMADDILFDKGQAEVSEGGQTVLQQIARSLVELSAYGIQVAGHTDSTRVVSAKTQEHFATNWELSSARATNVVRFLQERGKIPGARLVAAGFGEFRPAASNASEDGRRKNRRIEILLLPPAPNDPNGKIH